MAANDKQVDRSLFPDVETAKAQSKLARGVTLSVTLLFLVTCLAIGVIDAAMPIEPQKLAGHEKKKFEERHATAKISDGSFMKVLETDMKRSSRIRSLSAFRFAYLLFRVFGELGDMAVAGPNDWVFLRATLGNRPGTDLEIVLPSTTLLAAAARRFENRGVHWLSTPIPRKGVVAPQELPSGWDPRSGIEQAVVAELQRHGVEVIDLLPAMTSIPAEEAYQPWDTHWAHGGRFVTAQAIAKHLEVPAFEPTTQIVRLPNTPTQADSLRTAGLYSGRTPPSYLEIPTQLGVQVSGAVQLAAQPKDMVDFAVVGTSFSHSPLQTQLFEHFLGERVWNGSKPGLQIAENLGRFLSKTREMGLPKHIIHEFPVHLVLQLGRPGKTNHLRPTMVAMFLKEPAGPQHVVRALDEMNLTQAKGKKRKATWFLPSGRLVSSGDGILGVRLRRTNLVEEPPLIYIRNDNFSIRVQWGADQATTIAPVLEYGRTGSRTLISTEDRDYEVQIEFVTDLNLDEPVATALDHYQEDKQATVASFPENTIIPQFGGLVMQLGGSGSKAQDARIEVTAGSRILSFEVSACPQATILLNIGGLEGEPLESVRLITSPSMPSLPLEHIALHFQQRS